MIGVKYGVVEIPDTVDSKEWEIKVDPNRVPSVFVL